MFRILLLSCRVIACGLKEAHIANYLLLLFFFSPQLGPALQKLMSKFMGGGAAMGGGGGGGMPFGGGAGMGGGGGADDDDDDIPDLEDLPDLE